MRMEKTGRRSNNVCLHIITRERINLIRERSVISSLTGSNYLNYNALELHNSWKIDIHSVKCDEALT